MYIKSVHNFGSKSFLKKLMFFDDLLLARTNQYYLDDRIPHHMKHFFKDIRKIHSLLAYRSPV